MNKIICILAALAVAASAALFSGCGDGAPSKTEQSSEFSQASKQNDGDSVLFDDSALLDKLHPVNLKGDEFAGAWQITEGAGSGLNHFYFVFDGGENAYLVVGSTAFIGKYQAGDYKLEDNTVGKRFTTQLMFGLNGTYQYEFSDDGKTVVLTNDEGGKTTTMKAVESFDFIPEPEPGAEIDSGILGAWSDGNGGFRYFDESGVCYQAQNGINFYYYSYSAKNGECTMTYTMTDEVTDTVEYSVKGDRLTFNGEEYSRISADELV